jgi:hypothetical protein
MQRHERPASGIRRYQHVMFDAVRGISLSTGDRNYADLISLIRMDDMRKSTIKIET